MAVLLKAEGHKVKAVLDGPEALQAARELRPDVVFLDLMLPTMSGVEVAGELRRIDGCEGAGDRRRLGPRRGENLPRLRRPLPEAGRSRDPDLVPLRLGRRDP